MQQLSAQDREIDLGYLFGYYTQEGDHSAVTGGKGTEKLSDYDSRIVVHIPLDSTQSLGARVGINYYSSASSDRIDSKISSASRNDVRTIIELNYQKEKPGKNTTISLYSGGSVETDYISSSFGGGWMRNSRDENTLYGFDLKIFLDTWNIIVPEELRTTAYTDIPTDKRRTFNLSNFWSQIISRRSQIHLALDLVLQQGLLSTPFHRVYFENTPVPKIEKLPTLRFKTPLSFRWNYRIHEYWIWRNWTRYYWDTWNIHAFTWVFESPVLLPGGWSIAPYYRFHIQSAAQYFAPKAEHSIGKSFYTSDFDLSGLNSHRFGFALQYNRPLQLKTNQKKLSISSFELRSMRYLRSDGLSAWLAAFSIAVKI